MSNRLGGKQGTAYVGTNANQPPNYTFSTRDPNQNDIHASLGDLWLNQSNEALWVLVSLAGNMSSKGSIATWVQLDNSSGGGTTSFVTNAGTAVPLAGVIDVVGGMGITTSGAGHTVTITSTGVFYQYVSVNHAMSPYTVVNEDTYISVDSSAGPVIILFPNDAVLGEPFVVKDRTGNAAANNITLTTPGGTTNFDGSPTFVMDTNFQATSVIGNGTNYELY